MKFGVFYNPMVPRAPGQQDWEPGQEHQAFREMLEQIRFADSLGFDPGHHLWDAFGDFKAGRGDIRPLAGTPEPLLQVGAMFADLPGTMMCGPDRAREFTRTIEAIHADGLLLNQQFGRTKHEHLMESLEIWATQIIPEFREREPEHQAWRKQQLDGIDLPVVTSL